MFYTNKGVTIPTRVIALLMVLLFFISSCRMQFADGDDSPDDSLALIAHSVDDLKAAGLLDSPESLTPSFGESEVSEEFKKDAEDFVKDPESYLKRMNRKSGEGSKELALIESLYTGDTVGGVLEKMEAISPDLAREYSEAVASFVETSSDEAKGYVDSLGGMDNIRLTLIPVDTSEQKGIFDREMSWDSVHWYVGFSAATAAGAVAARYGNSPWITVPGWILFVAGSRSMKKQLRLWGNSTEFRFIRNICTIVADLYDQFREGEIAGSLMDAIINELENDARSDSQNAKRYLALENFLNGQYAESAGEITALMKDMVNYALTDRETGKKLVTIGVSTLATGTACRFTGIYGAVTERYNTMVTTIPDWLRELLVNFKLQTI